MTLAPLLYRASPVEHLRSMSTPHSRHDLEKYSHPISLESRCGSPLPTPAPSARDISRPSSTSTQASNGAIVHHHHHHHPYNNQNAHTQPHSSTSISLPGLSALASLASAPSSQLRYVAHTSAGDRPDSLSRRVGQVASFYLNQVHD
jgi:GATA-binding protein, other eukaryote